MLELNRVDPSSRQAATLRRLRLGVSLSALLAGLCACTASDPNRPQSTPIATVLQMSADAEKAHPTYVIAPGDSLTVRFYYNPQLDEDLQVRPDGDISLSLVGDVPAAGKTPKQLSDEITKAYGRYGDLTKPNATVLVRSFSNERAFLTGEVKTAGFLDMSKGAMTVMQAIASSGGVTDSGTLKDVLVMRRLPTQKAPLLMSLNLLRALDGSDPQQDVELMPNDVVYVPRSGIASADLAAKQLFFDLFNNSTSFNAAKVIQ